MKANIILSGVGGQGILSIAAVIGEAALQNNLYMKQSEVHGMSQRGGDVQSNLRISDSPIASDLIPLKGADLILSLEPMEALRYMPFLSDNGWIVSSSLTFKNIPDYPDDESVLNEIRKIKNSRLLDVEAIAKEVGSVRTSNMVLLGAALPYLGIPESYVENGIKSIFAKKGEGIVQLNLKALRAGYDHKQ
ncbi:MAG: indolepyruvate oxidoreductase subunit beta [Bacteroidia bacterium]|nr:indolepyruvate oxidoreductase subunit beta [Bacteroidia bacterium]